MTLIRFPCRLVTYNRFARWVKRIAKTAKQESSTVRDDHHTLVECHVLFVKDVWVQMFIFDCPRPMIPHSSRNDMLCIRMTRSCTVLLSILHSSIILPYTGAIKSLCLGLASNCRACGSDHKEPLNKVNEKYPTLKLPSGTAVHNLVIHQCQSSCIHLILHCLDNPSLYLYLTSGAACTAGSFTGFSVLCCPSDCVVLILTTSQLHVNCTSRLSARRHNKTITSRTATPRRR